MYGLTNVSGNLVGHQGYDVFGAPMPAPSGPAGQPFGFTGREHELDSGLVYARDRYLSTASGTWTQADRWGLIGGPAVYAYVFQAPTLLTDPTGHLPPPIWGAIIGGVFSLVSGAMKGMRGLQLAAFTANGAIEGAIWMLAPMLKAFPIASSAITNAIGAFVTSLVGSIIEKGWRSEWAWGDAFLSAFLGSFGTLLAAYRVATKGATSVFKGIGPGTVPWDQVANSFAVRSAGIGGFWDFALQSLMIPYAHLFDAEEAYHSSLDQPGLVCAP